MYHRRSVVNLRLETASKLPHDCLGPATEARQVRVAHGGRLEKENQSRHLATQGHERLDAHLRSGSAVVGDTYFS